MGSDCYLGDECRGPKYHVCLSGKEDTFPELLRQLFKAPQAGPRLREGNSWAQNEALDAANQARADEVAPRNQQMISDYATGRFSYDDLVEKYGCSKVTVSRILKKAEQQGLIIIRSRGDRVFQTI